MRSALFLNPCLEPSRAGPYGRSTTRDTISTVALLRVALDSWGVGGGEVFFRNPFLKPSRAEPYGRLAIHACIVASWK